LKLDARAKAVDKFLVKIGVQVLQHIKNNYRTERFVEILGTTGILWERQKLTAEQIKEEVDVSMETVSAPKVDPMVDRQQRLQVFGIAMQLLPFIQAGIVAIDINKLFAWVMESFGYKDVGKFFTPALLVNQPLQQQQISSGTSQQQTQQPSLLPSPNNMLQQQGMQSVLGGFNGLSGILGG
jgi:hypothetical protein